MTKVTILGQESKESKKLKPIEFTMTSCRGSLKFSEVGSMQHPCNWNNIVLLERNYLNGIDMMYCYDGDDRNYRKKSIIALGHFNDGVV